jgi:hypothetical protein
LTRYTQARASLAPRMAEPIRPAFVTQNEEIHSNWKILLAVVGPERTYWWLV